MVARGRCGVKRYFVSFFDGRNTSIMMARGSGVSHISGRLGLGRGQEECMYSESGGWVDVAMGLVSFLLIAAVFLVK